MYITVIGCLISSSEIECVTPEFSLVGVVNVSLSLNGFSNAAYTPATKFRYYKDADVLSFNPISGSTAGGMIITLFVNEVSSIYVLKCRFGSIEVIGQYINPDLVTCETPPRIT